MKNFNFQKLSVIDPKPIFPNDKILATSVGAKNIINKSKVFDNLEPALKNIDYVIATSARFRNKNIKHIYLGDRLLLYKIVQLCSNADSERLVGACLYGAVKQMRLRGLPTVKSDLDRLCAVVPKYYSADCKKAATETMDY